MDLNLRWARATNAACHLWQCQGEANDSTSEKHAEIWDYYTDEVLLILQNSETQTTLGSFFFLFSELERFISSVFLVMISDERGVYFLSVPRRRYDLLLVPVRLTRHPPAHQKHGS